MDIDKSPTTTAGDLVVHTGISCDICGVDPLCGTRYKCAVCNVGDDDDDNEIGFNLCQACYATAGKKHKARDGGHPFLVLERDSPLCMHGAKPLEKIYYGKAAPQPVVSNASVQPRRPLYDVTQDPYYNVMRLVYASTVKEWAFLRTGTDVSDGTVLLAQLRASGETDAQLDMYLHTFRLSGLLKFKTVPT